MLGGVLFNKVGGDAHCQWLREALEASGLSISVLGGIPKVWAPTRILPHAFRPCLMKRLEVSLRGSGEERNGNEADPEVTASAKRVLLCRTTMWRCGSGILGCTDR